MGRFCARGARVQLGPMLRRKRHVGRFRPRPGRLRAWAARDDCLGIVLGKRRADERGDRRAIHVSTVDLKDLFSQIQRKRCFSPTFRVVGGSVSLRFDLNRKA